MNYRKMGSLDWKVSALGLGCMRLPTKEVKSEKDDESKTIVDKEKSINLIRYAIDQGINYVDTAWPYHNGESEKILGEALQDGYRQKVKLATKLPTWEIKEQDDFDDFLNKQLEKLQVDYIDVYLLHALREKFFEIVKDNNLLDKMEEAKEKGLIKHIGFSFHDSYDVFKEIIDYYDSWDIAQIQYNYFDIDNQATTKGLKYAADKGIAIVIMEPLQGGKLTFEFPDIKQILKKRQSNTTLADIGLRFLWSFPEVSVVLSGMNAKWQIDENINSAQKAEEKKFTKEEYKLTAELRNTFKEHILIPCTRCEYCIPCPNHINIPGNFYYLNEFAWWGEEHRDEYIQRYQKFLKNEKEMNEAEEKKNGNASLCTDCGECLEKCPQQINIPEVLSKIDLIFGEGKKLDEILDQL
jgi:hypothetical protein